MFKPLCKERSEYINETKELSEKGLMLFSTLSDRLNSLKSMNSVLIIFCFHYYFITLALNLHEKQIQKLDQYINQVIADTTLRHKIETINLLLTTKFMENNESFGGQNNHELVDYHQIELLIIDLKRFIGYNVNLWNSRMSDFLKKSKYENV